MKGIDLLLWRRGCCGIGKVKDADVLKDIGTRKGKMSCIYLSLSSREGADFCINSESPMIVDCHPCCS